LPGLVSNLVFGNMDYRRSKERPPKMHLLTVMIAPFYRGIIF
jgi:hypothetical protein